MQPISAGFALPEQQLAEVRRYRDVGTLKVTAQDPTSHEALASGDVTFIDNRVDPTTGTIALKATFPNEDRRLWPGEFVDVVLTLTVDPRAIVVPTAAVQTGPNGRYVYVVKPDETAESRPVTVAREAGGESVIASGLRPGESVVVEGQLRLVPGARVEARAASPGTAAGAAATGAASPPTGAASPATSQ
jgi:multidrug efflux system membrane fusion protein